MTLTIRRKTRSEPKKNSNEAEKFALIESPSSPELQTNNTFTLKIPSLFLHISKERTQNQTSPIQAIQTET